MTAPRIYDPYQRINLRRVRPLSPTQSLALYLWQIACLIAIVATFAAVLRP